MKMFALLRYQRRDPSHSLAKEVLPDDQRQSSLFFIGNSESSSCYFTAKKSLPFTEVIPSIFFFSFKREKGIGFRKREVNSSETVESWREPLGTLLSLVESPVSYPFIYIGVRGYFLIRNSFINK
jgi:hypothetical protein